VVFRFASIITNGIPKSQNAPKFWIIKFAGGAIIIIKMQPEDYKQEMPDHAEIRMLNAVTHAANASHEWEAVLPMSQMYMVERIQQMYVSE
jgi:hypothetical protein